MTIGFSIWGQSFHFFRCRFFKWQVTFWLKEVACREELACRFNQVKFRLLKYRILAKSELFSLTDVCAQHGHFFFHRKVKD